MDSTTFLDRLPKAKLQPCYVLHGDEAFLKRQVQNGLRQLILEGDTDSFAFSRYSGDKAEWSAVIDDLQTLPFLSPRRLVMIDAADPFVTANRTRLEKLFKERVEATAIPTGILVLEVASWTSTTKLAKLAPDSWVIVCKKPSAAQLPQWCVGWCKNQYGKDLSTGAARLLVDLIGAEMGQLDQELNKLSVYVGSAAKIEPRDVDEIVGRRRAEAAWRILDFIGAGQPREAMELLEQILDQGEEPLRLLGAIGSQMRKLAQAARLSVQGVSLNEALSRAGVPGFPAAREGAEQQLRHLGRRRLDRLYDWLLEADQDMKGASLLTPRLVLERLLVRLARVRT